MTLDLRSLRDAFGQFATGIVVVTVMGPQGPVGMTLNSFTSVSLDPPLVLWCLDKRSSRHAVFLEAPAYAVSVLSTDHHAISTALAGKGAHGLNEAPLISTQVGPPILRGALASFECRPHEIHDAGDHSIVVARVMDFALHGPKRPLVYFRGGYGLPELGRRPAKATAGLG